MLSYGNTIISATEQLRKLTIDELYRKIAHPTDELIATISQLRALQALDIEKYKYNKRLLPFFTCGIFTPPVRKIVNFHFAGYFVLDIDHIGQKNINIAELKNELMKDERIVLMFISPGNDGLKIVFHLMDKCFDAAKFSLFYKVFASRFSQQYHLEQVIDNRTSDVSRACFISADPEAWYKPDAVAVNMESVIDFENQLSVSIIEHELHEKEKSETRIEPIDDTNVKNEISTDILSEIRQKLNPRLAEKKKKDVYVPEQLNAVIPAIEVRANELEIVLLEVIPIQYGKKIKFGVKHFWAEINVFHGKRGFSVVKTPKSGSNAQLTDIAYDLVNDVIYNLNET
jgi:hypothetical protein